MSIIGTRPPLISETNFYELHHRARLAIKPGMHEIRLTYEADLPARSGLGTSSSFAVGMRSILL